MSNHTIPIFEMKKILLILINCYCFFSVSQTNYFTDNRDGRIYKTVKIGEQIWMAENLNSAYYFDGSPVELITENETWSKSLFGYSFYDFNEVIQKQNGNLYKYFTATDVCPFNWHLPTNYDWDKMLFTLGKNKPDYNFKSSEGEVFLAGNEIKIKDPTLWQFWEREDGEIFESNQEVTNESHFSVLPSGYRYSDGEFADLSKNTWFWSADSDLDFSNENSGLITYSLIFKRDHVIKNSSFDYLKWGASIRCVKDDLNPNLTIVHDSLNQFSFSKQNWKTITTNNEVVSLNAKQLNYSKSALIVLDVFKQNVSNFDKNYTYISSLTKDKKCFSLILGNEEQPCIYFFNIEKQTYKELNLCNQILWSSYSPNQDFVLYKTSPERFPDDLTVYEIESNELNYIDFYKQGFAKNKVGYIAPYEILRLDETSVNWINQFEFEVIANIYSEMEDFEGAKIEEIPATELRDDARSATYIYTYNTNLKKIVKAIIIK
jgi:uncharacterized protein (TIGR02145 family)